MRKERPPVESHDFVTKVVSLALGLVAVGGMGGIIFLTYFEKAIDAAVATMVGGAIGALGTLLSNVRNASQEPSDVTVVNPPTDPVNTTEAEPKPEGDV